MIKEILMCVVIWIMSYHVAQIVNKTCGRREEDD